MKPKKIFTKAEKNALMWLYCGEGRTLKEIAKVFQVPYTTLQKQIDYNNIRDMLNENRKIRDARLKENLFQLSFPREVEEKKYEMVEYVDKETGEVKRVPALKEIKKKQIDPNPEALKITTINMLRWPVSSSKLVIEGEKGEKDNPVYIVVKEKGVKKE